MRGLEFGWVSQLKHQYIETYASSSVLILGLANLSGIPQMCSMLTLAQEMTQEQKDQKDFAKDLQAPLGCTFWNLAHYISHASGFSLVQGAQSLGQSRRACLWAGKLWTRETGGLLKVLPARVLGSMSTCSPGATIIQATIGSLGKVSQLPACIQRQLLHESPFQLLRLISTGSSRWSLRRRPWSRESSSWGITARIWRRVNLVSIATLASDRPS